MNLTNNVKWVDHLKRIRGSDREVVSRGKMCVEDIGVMLDFDMSFPAITMTHRKLSYALMFAEAEWILNGREDLTSIGQFCPRMREFSDDGLTLRGAYGPKFISQAHYIADCFTQDPGSRQAVMTMWERNPPMSKDIPCTCSLQFLIRLGADDQAYLHMIANMRSSDTWLGLPYDIFSFTMMAHYIKLMLSPGMVQNVGMLTMMLGSSHIYESDFAKVDKFLALPYESGNYDPMDLYDLNDPADLLAWLRSNRDNPRAFLKS